MFGPHKANAPLCRTPVLVCMFDQGLTLWYQSEMYWLNYRFAIEGNPQGRLLLQTHPLAFVAGVTSWAALFTLAILWLPGRAAVTASLAVTIGHVWGAGTWLLNHCRPGYGYWYCIGLVVVASVMTVGAWERHGAELARSGPLIDPQRQPT